MPRWSDDPSHLLGMITNYLRLDDPAPAPTAQFAAGQRAAEAMIADAGQSGAGDAAGCAGRLVRLALRRARRAGRAARDAEVPAGAGPGRAARPAGRGRAASWRRTAGSLSADDVFFLDLAEVRRGLAGERTSATLVAAAPGGVRARSCAAGTSRGCCCPTAPSRRRWRRRRRPDGRPGRQPGLGRHGHRQRPGSSSTRSAPTSSPARSWSRPRPTRAGPRCSSPRAGW